MTDLNLAIFELIHRWAGNIWLDDAGVFLAKYLPYILVVGFLTLSFRKKDWRMRVLIFVDAALAVILARGIITELIRFFYHYPRPFEALNFVPLIGGSGYSFPSGHAAFFFALAIVTLYYNRRMGIWYFVFAILNGIARIYVGVHWPMDIVGGAVIGILCGMIAHKLLEPSLKAITPSVDSLSN